MWMAPRWCRSCSTRIDRASRQDRLGARIVTGHLALVMLIDLIRYQLSTGAGGTGWLHGLTDPVTAAALSAIHADPARRWTVQLLAGTVGVSRSTLAARFKAAVGHGPLEYLTRWRLELGAHRLAATDQTISAIASAVGYASEAAFGLAFKRELGTAPATSAGKPARRAAPSHLTWCRAVAARRGSGQPRRSPHGGARGRRTRAGPGPGARWRRR